MSEHLVVRILDGLSRFKNPTGSHYVLQEQLCDLALQGVLCPSSLSKRHPESFRLRIDLVSTAKNSVPLSVPLKLVLNPSSACFGGPGRLLSSSEYWLAGL